MHTCAQPAEADLFGGADPVVTCIEITGTVAHNASVRTKPVGPEGVGHPVVCIELRDVGPARQQVHVERPFPASAHEAAEAEASRLREGLRITVTCPLSDIRLSLPNTQQIFIHPIKP